MICYAFPLAHEAAPLLALCTQKESFSIGQLKCTLGNFRDRPVLIALTGMGRKNAKSSTETLFSFFRLQGFVLAGYGGALMPTLKVGQVVISNNFSSEEVVPFLRLLSGVDFATFCTTDKVTGTVRERDRHARSTKGQVVDMETDVVAEVVRARQVPFVAVRVISDDYAHELPVEALAAGFDAERGVATPMRLLARLALHGKEIKPFRDFVKNLSVARRNLTLFLQQLNDELPKNW